MPGTFQEFYCSECPADSGDPSTGGYFLVNLNTRLNHIVNIICPNCKHEHKRAIVNGTILENGRANGEAIENVRAPKDSWSRKPLTSKMADPKNTRRDGVIITNEKDVCPGKEHDGFRDALRREQWLRVVGRERYGDDDLGEDAE